MDTNYKEVLDSLFERTAAWETDAKVIRYQLSEAFFGARTEAELIVTALQRVVDDAKRDLELAEAPF